MRETGGVNIDDDFNANGTNKNKSVRMITNDYSIHVIPSPSPCTPCKDPPLPVRSTGKVAHSLKAHGVIVAMAPDESRLGVLRVCV